MVCCCSSETPLSTHHLHNSTQHIECALHLPRVAQALTLRSILLGYSQPWFTAASVCNPGQSASAVGSLFKRSMGEVRRTRAMLMQTGSQSRLNAGCPLKGQRSEFTFNTALTHWHSRWCLHSHTISPAGITVSILQIRKWRQRIVQVHVSLSELAIKYRSFWIPFLY